MIRGAMIDEEFQAQLAGLGLDRQWAELGVLTEAIVEEMLEEMEEEEEVEDTESPLEILREAVFCYFDDRTAIDDVILAGLLDVATRSPEEVARQLAAWKHWTAAQLAQIARHDASAPGVRRLAAQRLRVHALEAGADVAVNLVGFTGTHTDAPDGDPTCSRSGTANIRRRSGSPLPGNSRSPATRATTSARCSRPSPPGRRRDVTRRHSASASIPAPPTRPA
jgi:hypothetical protein